jgi:hypothetical protein
LVKKTEERLSMKKFLKPRALDLPIAVIALSALATEPAWAGEIVPGPVTGGLAGAAIIGAIVIAKLWRRK